MTDFWHGASYQSPNSAGTGPYELHPDIPTSSQCELQYDDAQIHYDQPPSTSNSGMVIPNEIGKMWVYNAFHKALLILSSTLVETAPFGNYFIETLHLLNQNSNACF